MAYADQTLSGNKIIAIIIVALVHLAVGYALVTGLAYSAVKKAIERVSTVDIEEPEPEKSEEPPPPDTKTPPPPPVVAPPPPINIAVTPPAIQTVERPPPPAPVIPVARPAPPAPPPPPRFTPKQPEPRGRTQSWVTNDDYPPRAFREERQGTTRFSLTIGADGRATGCNVTGSSGHSDLDAETCKLMTRRARFNPATDGEGQPTTGTWSGSFRWVIND